MFGLGKKSKADEQAEQYKLDLIRLCQRATDATLSIDDRAAAQETLRELDMHHTRKMKECGQRQSDIETRKIVLDGDSKQMQVEDTK